MSGELSPAKVRLTDGLGPAVPERAALAPCPFCGERPRLTLRPDDAEATMYFAAVACYCGGYSACAHKMATAPTADEAEAKVRATWNCRPNMEQERRIKVLEDALWAADLAFAEHGILAVHATRMQVRAALGDKPTTPPLSPSPRS